MDFEVSRGEMLRKVFEASTVLSGKCKFISDKLNANIYEPNASLLEFMVLGELEIL